MQGGAYFDIITPVKTYHFRAKTKREMMNWVDSILTASGNLFTEICDIPIITENEESKKNELESIAIPQNTDNNQTKIHKLQKISNTCADCSSLSLY